MDFWLNDEQKILRYNIREFGNSRSSYEFSRQLCLFPCKRIG